MFVGSRRLAAQRGARAFSSSVTRPGFFELRTDMVKPKKLDAYLKEQKSTAAARKRIFPGWLGIWRTELGGACHQVHHLYHWDSYDQRDATRFDADDEYEFYGKILNAKSFPGSSILPLPTLRDKLDSSSACVFMEATDTLHACGLPGALDFRPAALDPAASPSRATWELRSHQLRLGYDAVPEFLKLYSAGLEDKLCVDDSGASALCSLLYSDNGPLNVVHELWRHESLQRSVDSRVASRKATKWREAIGQIATMATSFETRYLRPLASSPWQ